MTTITGAERRLDPGLVRLALVLSLGGIAALLDTTIVAVAIDRLSHEFAAPVATIQWVTTAYLLALTAVIPLSGWTAERFGGARMWVVALALFLLGSVGCGLAWSVGSLIGFRVLQGLGGGLLLTLVRTLLVGRAPNDALGRLMTFVIVPTQLAPVFGPVLGGLVVSTLGWRWAFFVNVPVCVLAIVFSLKMVRGGPAAERSRLDVLGLALLSPGLALLVFGLSEFGLSGTFGGRALAGSAAGVALLAAYMMHALRTRIRPVLDLRLFRDRAFRASAALVFVFGGSLFGALLLLPLFFQQVRGASPLQAGLMMAPQGLGAITATYFVGRLLDRTGASRRIAVIGLVLCVAGTVPLALAGPGTPVWLLVVTLYVRGLGLTTALLPTITATYATLPRTDVAAATAGTRVLQQVGGSLGTAVLAVVLQRSGSFGPAFWITVAITCAAFAAAIGLPSRR